MNNKKLLEFTFFRGRVALNVMLRALGIGKGDFVACQAFTCVAVPEAIIATGAKPLYIDIEKDGYNMDINSLKTRITKKVKAVIVQHSFGIPAKIDEICDLLNSHHIPIIEDCCLSMFSTYKGKELGSFGIASFYSYEWGKPIVAGLGGSLVLNDHQYYEKVKSLVKNLKKPSSLIQFKIFAQFVFFYVFYRPKTYWFLKNLFHLLSKNGLSVGNFNAINKGAIPIDFNFQMIALCKYLLKIKIRRIDLLKKSIKKVVDFYGKEKFFFDTMLFIKHDYYLCRLPLLMKNKFEKQKILHEAKKSKIEAADWYSTPIHPLVNALDFEKINYELGSCPNAEDTSSRVVSFPINSKVKKNYIKKVERLLRSVQNEKTNC